MIPMALAAVVAASSICSPLDARGARLLVLQTPMVLRAAKARDLAPLVDIEAVFPNGWRMRVAEVRKCETPRGCPATIARFYVDRDGNIRDDDGRAVDSAHLRHVRAQLTGGCYVARQSVDVDARSPI